MANRKYLHHLNMMHMVDFAAILVHKVVVLVAIRGHTARVHTHGARPRCMRRGNDAQPRAVLRRN